MKIHLRIAPPSSSSAAAAGGGASSSSSARRDTAERKRIRREKECERKQTGINDVPQVILCFIISLLPLKEQARSSVVCRAWRNLWLSSPNWRLELSIFPRVRHKKLKFEDLVDRVIHFPGRSGIHHMRLVHSAYDATSQKAKLWVECLLSQGILSLDLNIMDPIPPPLSLYRSETLVELRLCLNHEHIRLPPTVSLPRLTIFALRKALFIGTDSFQSLVNACAVLATLDMRECAIIGVQASDVTIPQASLKEVMLENCHLFHETRLHVLSMGLRVFCYRGLNMAGQKHDFNMQLAAESAALESDEFHCLYTQARNEGRGENYGENVSGIMASFCNTRRLVLSDWCIEYLTNIPNTMKFPPFMRLRCLDISMWPNSGHIYVVAYLIRFSPCLHSLSLSVSETLVMEGIYSGDRTDYPQPDPDFLARASTHYHLKRIEMKKFGIVSVELDLIKFILKNAVVLELLSLKSNNVGDSSLRKSVRNTIKSYPRASDKAKVCIY